MLICSSVLDSLTFCINTAVNLQCVTRMFNNDTAVHDVWGSSMTDDNKTHKAYVSSEHLHGLHPS